MIYDLYDAENRIELPDLRVVFPQIFEAYFADKNAVEGKTVFEFIKSESITDKSYVLIETRHFQGKNLNITICDDQGNQLSSKGHWLDPLQVSKQAVSLQGVVGAFCEEVSKAEKETYEDKLIVSLKTLFTQTNNKLQTNKLLFLMIDAYGPNPEYQENTIVYHAEENKYWRNKNNVW